MTEVQERCIKRFARNAKKNAMFHLSPEEIVPFIAKNAFQSEKTAADKNPFIYDRLLAHWKLFISSEFFCVQDLFLSGEG